MIFDIEMIKKICNKYSIRVNNLLQYLICLLSCTLGIFYFLEFMKDDLLPASNQNNFY